MKKILIILFISVILNWIFIYKNINLNSRIQEIILEKNNLLDTINTLKQENENILKKTYCNCKKWFNFWDVCINKIDKSFIKNNFESNQWNWTYNLFLDFWLEKNDLKKLNKILKIINNDYKKIKFQELRLSCNFNFDNNTLELLKKLNINKLFIDTEECGFYNWKNSYKKDLVKKFFVEAKSINELEIWYIITDLYKRENWEIKVYRDQ